MHGVRLMAIGGTAAGVLLVAACGYTGPTSTEVRTYTIGDQVTLVSVNSRAGAVEFLTGDGPVQVTETLRYTNTKPDTAHTADGRTLNLADNGCGGHFRRCEVDYKVRVPAATGVKVQSSAGRVTLTGLAGDIDVTASAGKIEGTGLTSRHTTVKASAGQISLQYTAVPASVTARDSAGAVEIEVPGSASYAVDAHTSAGKTTIDVPQDPNAASKIYVRDSAGAIRITSG